MVVNELNKLRLDYSILINSVDLDDLKLFLKSLNTERWVPFCYWNRGEIKDKPNILTEFVGKNPLRWSIYSFLVKNGYMLIENPHWCQRNPRKGNNPNEFYEYYSYYNELVYDEIINRLHDEGYLKKKVIVTKLIITQNQSKN